MTRLAWGAHGERYFEAGTDRGVLYLPGVDGVPWNGLKGVNEAPTGGEPKPYYIDGFKYLNVASAEEFQATLEAFSSPLEFGVCDGTKSIHNGLFATQQPRKEFSLSYRTLVGNDFQGVDHGYKLHIVYNALAAPSSRNNQTAGGGSNPLGLSWSITTKPPKMDGLKPTAHLVIDSRLTPPNLMKAIEDILYGTDMVGATLPPIDELMELFQSPGSVVRTNYIQNPRFVGPVDWGITNGSTTTNAGVLSYTATGPVTSNLLTPDEDWFDDWEEGDPLSAGYLVLNTSALDKVLRVAVWNGTSYVYGPDTLVPVGETRLVKIEDLVAPAGVPYLQPRLHVAAAFPLAEDDTLDISEPIVEKRRFLGTYYFDGATADSDVSTFDWEGVADLSRSLERSWY